MQQPKFPRGSEWRRWDLHVHTPYSALNNGFGDNVEEYAKKFFEQAVQKRVVAIGVTDYFTIEGYKDLKELQSDQEKMVKMLGEETANQALQILLIPNIEFRSSIIVQRRNGSDSRVNFHVLFSPEVAIRDIEENFLHSLRFTAQSEPGSPDEKPRLTIRNLEDLGERLRSEHPNFADRNSLYIGMMNAVIDHEAVTKELENLRSTFKDRYLLILPADEDLAEVQWDGQGHNVRKVFLQKTHMIFSSNRKTRDFGLGRMHSTPQEFLSEFRTLKPCVHGSDAHDYQSLFEPNQRRYCWIKADVTFEGLRQVLNEPDQRVCIQPQPDALASQETRRPRIIESVKVAKRAESTLTEHWFQCSIPFNPGLVAIIGNKGSGKSALAEIIALVGNTPLFDKLSFLTKDRFRQGPKNRAKEFEANLIWLDETTDGPVSLSEDPTPESLKKLRFIPQSFLENVCNALKTGRSSLFYKELEEVIFSHVPPAEQLGFETLSDLLQSKGEEVQASIEQNRDDLSSLNRELVDLLQRTTNSHRETLARRLEEKKRELADKEKNEPEKVPNPESDPSVQEEAKAVAKQVDELSANLEGVTQKIQEKEELDQNLAKRASIASKLLGKLQNLRTTIETALHQIREDSETLDLEVSDLVTYQILTGPVDTLLRQLGEERGAIHADLDESVEDSLADSAKKLRKKIATLKEKLTAGQQLYQEYLAKLSNWEKEKAAILGDKRKPGTVLHLEGLIEALTNLPEEIEAKRAQRREVIAEIHARLAALAKDYRNAHGHAQSYIASFSEQVGAAVDLEFTVSLEQRRFAEDFLGRINQGRSGNFYGAEDGRKAVSELLESVDWSNEASTLEFLDRVEAALEKKDGHQLHLADQLKNGSEADTIVNFYNYLYGLEYLEQVYILKWQGKRIEQLSPGERGNLLLIFYLLIDKSEIPLVIDQPEENLDNQTVVKTLVPCILEAKKRRQIIIVTHNPNLAVVCDADQIIHAAMDKDDGSRITYTAGSIEDPTINQRIVDVLEGTRPAFDLRDAKYLPARDSS
jgi:ABC-type lipoprotein export system ATPase subunit